MTAAEKTLTETGRVRMGEMEIVTGTVTIASTLDWVDLDNLVPPLALPAGGFVHAYTVADGVDGEAFFSTATPDKVFFTQTGAMNVFIMGPSKESTGGD